jgi:hypothetical protein
LSRLNVDYLKSQIETGDAGRTKTALQQLCKFYRQGFRIHPAQLFAMEQSIVGLLYTLGRKDEKVRRWALNALARLGTEPNCIVAITHTLTQYSAEPQTSAAAIAAIYRLSRKATDILKGLSFDEQMITLAALQHVDANNLDLSALPINVETASPDLLKLALVVVGLDRAPPNMLHPRHDNRQLVRALGGHDDNIVSQYSVWAITENPSLRLGDLGIDIRDIERRPANVRAWVFRLIAMTPEDAEQNYEYLELGMRDPAAEARVGLAIGLRDTFFDGLEAIVLDWFTTEYDAEVRQHLLDHMIRQAPDCASYEAMTLDIYEKEPAGSGLREHMEVTAAGTYLYGKFKQKDEMADLFRGALVVTNKTYNITGSIQGGAVAVGGDATNIGPTAIHYDAATVESIKLQLSKLEHELHQAAIDTNVKGEILKLVEEAKADPSPDKLSKVTTAIRQVGEVVLASTAIWEMGHILVKLAGLG